MLQPQNDPIQISQKKRYCIRSTKTVHLVEIPSSVNSRPRTRSLLSERVLLHLATSSPPPSVLTPSPAEAAPQDRAPNLAHRLPSSLDYAEMSETEGDSSVAFQATKDLELAKAAVDAARRQLQQGEHYLCQIEPFYVCNHYLLAG